MQNDSGLSPNVLPFISRYIIHRLRTESQCVNCLLISHYIICTLNLKEVHYYSYLVGGCIEAQSIVDLPVRMDGHQHN